ncbi:inositol hexakisphosphate and diphosphoinositol-pentakisphosphate kinase 2-like isoform X2 [Paramacrobiotus metropolitanus]|uniref:inositol hexakisphosphate and diphosphoinositol-pentakisphosphate kinase 2-like isoform X2 n=1 Tax=Paramacrobiotus metropolitanus TaxID=2943436 RepID=UPI002445A551|nr:inositol hexakisphosphate and diphosphoinositol-pentakisphosphate kinase 2-like isoform X2 [Paramacrobiotus metropolitanus]
MSEKTDMSENTRKDIRSGSGPDGSPTFRLNGSDGKELHVDDDAIVPLLVSHNSVSDDNSALSVIKSHSVSGGHPSRKTRFTVSKVAEDVLLRRQSADRSSTLSVNTANKTGPNTESVSVVPNGNTATVSGGNAFAALPFGKSDRVEDKEAKVSIALEKTTESGMIHEPFVFLGVCAMAKKARSKYMTEILSRITQEFEQIKMVIFPENVIMNEPVEKWPTCDALISFYSGHFPLDKAVQYAKLRQPFLVNDLEMQYAIQNRQKVYEILEKAGVEVPRYAVLDRDCGDPSKARLEEFDDHIIVNGVQFNKPFVEKPVCAEDHNIYIYYPTSAGSGSQRLFRKIGTRSSVYSNESRVRQTGSYIYEEFMPTDGTDVKVYTVGPEYAHAEARKSPALDGVVERDKEGKELRFPIILNNVEKLIARRVCIAFQQAVCGFDLLRANGRSYVCDVNGFSFVKNSMIYYNDFAKIVANMVLRKLAPELHIRWSMPYQLEDPPFVTTTLGQLMELRCVVAVVRHGDRTPKQKLKMELHHPKFIDMFLRFGGTFDDNGREIKLKRPSQLQEVLNVVRDLLLNHRSEAIVKERRAKLVQLKSVLEMYGHFSGINRKVQIKYLPLDSPDLPESAVPAVADTASPVTTGCLLLIMKWGGELTPLGKYQSEQLGQMFRCMYPGSGEASMKRGHGLLRLHSTFRHDLKIYASDEGRVQTTAAAFAKGLLALEGELTPILVQMVKSANTNGLLDSDLDARDHEKAVKKTLRAIMKRDKTFSDEDVVALNPTNSPAIKTAMEAIKNPVMCCGEVHKYITELNKAIKEKAANTTVELPMLYAGESWELLQRRWGKLEKDFRLQDGSFDITKIPDIYDCIRFDMHHNQWISRLGFASKLFALARHLSDIVVPLEYGITANEKLAIAQGIATPLLEKIRSDLRQVVSQTDDVTSKSNENSNKLHPRYTDSSSGRLVRSRLYFTSESHIHSLVNILRFGGLFEENDKQWNRALEYLSRVPELNFLTQIVIMLYEDSNKTIDSDDRFHVELHFSSGMLRRSDYKDMHGGKNRRNSIQNDDLEVSTTESVSDGAPKSTSSKTILSVPSNDEKADNGPTAGYFKSKKDRLIAKVRELGIIKNRIFSTAVIKGLDQSAHAHASPLDDEDGTRTYYCKPIFSMFQTSNLWKHSTMPSHSENWTGLC